MISNAILELRQSFYIESLKNYYDDGMWICDINFTVEFYGETNAFLIWPKSVGLSCKKLHKF